MDIQSIKKKLGIDDSMESYVLRLEIEHERYRKALKEILEDSHPMSDAAITARRALGSDD